MRLARGLTLVALVLVSAACTVAPAVRPARRPAPSSSSAPPALPRARIDRSGLPTDGEYAAGATLIAGHRRYVGGKRTGRAVLWTSDDEFANAGVLWSLLVRQYRSTGLYPVVLESEYSDPRAVRPWLNGEFDLSHRTDPDRVGTSATLFAGLYRNALRDFVTGDVPTSPPTGLGTNRAGRPSLDAADRQIESARGRIGLVAVDRPADVPYVIGWLGATNYFDGGTVTAVLRTWEDRYGAQLVRMGLQYVQVSVPEPPQTLAAARRVALEHVAFCGDEVYQESDGFEDHARSLVGAGSWFCWWD